MRVGLIIYGSIHTVTGGYIYDCKLVDYLKSQGAVVKIFSQPYKKFFGCLKNNFSKKILNEICDFSPDIILQDEMNFLSLFLLNKKLKAIGNFTLISIVHLLQSSARNHFLMRWLIKKIEKAYLKSVHGFIFNSFATEASVIRLVGRHSNSLVVHPGKDRLQIKILKEHILHKCYHNKLYIIFIGNLRANKGLHILLQALAKIDPSFWQLSVIGGLHFDLKYSKKILNMITHLKIADQVKVLGVLDIENLKRELIAHHILVVPSYYESFGMVYAEAMGAGLPVIASKIGGGQEIVMDTINGFLVEPGDCVMIRDNICKLIENPELLIKMSLSSLSAYQKMPSWDDSMGKAYAFLGTLLLKPADEG